MFINRYKESSWYKSVAKDLVFLIRYVYLFVANGFRRRTVLFYPEFPLYKTEINKVMRSGRYNITNNPRLASEHVVAWEDTTYRQTPQAVFQRIAGSRRVLNLHCTDISKETVERVFQRVFGYGLTVDPCVYEGRCVEKSNSNAQHDGRIIDCPIERPRPGYIYQRLVDNQVTEDAAGDLRAPVYGDRIPLVYVRYRPLHSRFHGDYLEQMRDIEDFLSSEEIARVLAFARAMGLDYGDLDMLRDPADGRLYIVDVNNTPRSPDHRSRADIRRSVARGRCAFESEFAASSEALQQPEELPD